MALYRSVVKEDDILCELYGNVCDNSGNEILDSDTHTTTSHTTIPRKQFQPSVIVFTSDSDPSTEEEESSEPESSDDKTNDVWFKTVKKPSSEPFLGTTGLNIVIGNLESVLLSN